MRKRIRVEIFGTLRVIKWSITFVYVLTHVCWPTWLSYLQLVILPYIYSTALCYRYHLSGRGREHSQVFRRDTKYVFYSLVVNVVVPCGWELSDGGYYYNTYQQYDKQHCYNKQEPRSFVWFLWYQSNIAV